MSPNAFTLWITGLSGTGKTTLARLLRGELGHRGQPVELLDRDSIAEQAGPFPSYRKDVQDEIAGRVGWVCERLNRNGIPAVAALLSPSRDLRQRVRSRIPNFVEVYLMCPFDVLAERRSLDVNHQALAGEIGGFEVVDAQYEPPLGAELTYYSDGRQSPEEIAEDVVGYLALRGLLPQPEAA